MNYIESYVDMGKCFYNMSYKCYPSSTANANIQHDLTKTTSCEQAKEITSTTSDNIEAGTIPT